MDTEYITIKNLKQKTYNTVIFELSKEQRKEHEHLIEKYNKENSDGLYLIVNYYYYPDGSNGPSDAYKKCEMGGHDVLKEAGFKEDKNLSCPLLKELI